MRTDELIVELARAAGPVHPLPRPSMRLARWTAVSALLMALAVVVIGARADVRVAMATPMFAGMAVVTFVTALLSAASALVLSVPGAERSPWQRVSPLLAGTAWTVALAVLLTTEGEAIGRLLQFPFHWLCLIEIAGLGLVPGWILFSMLRDAAPLRLGWSGALATLAAAGMSAVATQFLCPVDDPAHQLVGHVLPVAVFAMLGVIGGQRYLDRLGTP